MITVHVTIIKKKLVEQMLLQSNNNMIDIKGRNHGTYILNNNY